MARPHGFWLEPGSREPVPRSENQWSFGEGRVSRLYPFAVELGKPSPERLGALEEGRGL